MDKHDKTERRTITTTNGMEVPLRAVSETYIRAASTRLEAEFRKRGEPIDPPTYTVQLAGGSEEVQAHDATTLEVHPEQTGIQDASEAAAEAARRTVANRAAWKAHLEARERLEREQARATSRVMLEAGLDLELPADGTWTRRQARMGVEIPEDPDERRYHWLTTEVLVTPDDLMQAIEGITQLSFKGAIGEEDIAAAMGTFRSRVQGAADRGLAARGIAVAVQRQAGGAADGEGLGPEPDGLEGLALPGPGGDGGD